MSLKYEPASEPLHISMRVCAREVPGSTPWFRGQPNYWGTSLTRKCTPLGPYRRPVSRVLGGS